MSFHPRQRSFSDDSNVVPLTQRTSTDYPGCGDLTDLRNPLVQIRLDREVKRKWRKLLTFKEYAVLLFIFDWTVGWSRASWVFSYRFLREGDQQTCGLGIGETQLREAIQKLEKLGMIEVDRADLSRGMHITLNLNWKSEADMALCIPKRLQGGDKSAAHNDGFDAEPPSEIRGTLPRKAAAPSPGNPDPFIVPVLEPNSGPPLPARIREAGVVGSDFSPAVNIRTRQRPSSPVKETNPPSTETTAASLLAQASAGRKLDKGSLQPGALEKTFRAAFEDAYAELPGAICLPWTRVHLANVRKVLVRSWHGSPEALHEFIAWTVDKWDLLRGTTFNWMTKSPPPAFPDIGFIITHRARILAVFNDRRRDTWIKSIDDREERRYHELVTTAGLTPEQARMQIAEDRAAAKLREEMAKTQRESRAAMRRAEQAEKRAAERRAPHPESAVAVQQRIAAFNASLPPVNPNQSFEETLRLLGEAAAQPFDESK